MVDQWIVGVYRRKSRLDSKDSIVAGPVPAPLPHAETYYGYQIVVRVHRMMAFSQGLAGVLGSIVLPGDITLAVDVHAVGMGFQAMHKQPTAKVSAYAPSPLCALRPSPWRPSPVPLRLRRSEPRSGPRP